MALSVYDKHASFPDPSDPTTSLPILNFRPGRPAPPGTMVQSPWEVVPARTANEGGADRGYPAVTRNAVTAAVAPVASTPRTANEGGADRGYPDFTTQSVPVPADAPSRGNRAGGNSPPSVAAPNVVVMGPGARAATPSYPTIQFAAAPPAVAQAAADFGGGLGMISPQAQYEANSLFDEGRKLLSSAGIVDRLRGRQLLRQRARLLEGATDIARTRTAGAVGAAQAQAAMLGAQTGAFRASNEVPLALLDAASRRYASDASREAGMYASDVSRANSQEAARVSRANNLDDADVRRYGIDATTESARYRTDADVAMNLPDIQRKQQILELYQSGRVDEAGDLATIYSRARPDPRPQLTTSPDGSYVLVMRPGATKPEYFDIKAMQAAVEAERRNALRP